MTKHFSKKDNFGSGAEITDPAPQNNFGSTGSGTATLIYFNLKSLFQFISLFLSSSRDTFCDWEDWFVSYMKQKYLQFIKTPFTLVVVYIGVFDSVFGATLPEAVQVFFLQR